MRPLASPYDAIVADRPASISLRGATLLANRLFTKDNAFSEGEREAFGLHGLLPDAVLGIDDQVTLELEHIRRKADPLERYIGLMALQDRNATLYYRVLAENLEELIPIVYTPTVARACLGYSHILRKTRGTWIRPEDVHRIPQILRNGPYEDVRLIVVTDNERILGLGDVGAGGMAISIGKAALYTGAGGIYPALTLPVSLDVGTDNPELLADPLYLGHREPRLRGAAYDELVGAFVEGVTEVWPGCMIQWEDFKQHNALRILDRYRDRVPSFNDDIQGTAAVVLAGVLAASRHLGRPLGAHRFLLVGAGAAGIGIARLLRRAMLDDGVPPDTVRRNLMLVDSTGPVRTGRSDLAEKAEFAVEVDAVRAMGLSPDHAPSLRDVVAGFVPTVMVGTTGRGGTFTADAVRAMADAVDRPIIMPLSNPTASSEATPADLLAWTDGRALVATGSPFPPVGGTVIGQANNVFVFPGIGLGALVAEAATISDGMFLAAAHAIADLVSPRLFGSGSIYPHIGDLRTVARAVAVAVAREALASGGAGSPDTVEAAVDSAMWWPDYVPYVAG